MSRLNAGYCLVRNPVGGQTGRVSLLPHDISGIVFWSKNPRPMLASFTEIHQRGIPFYVQFTINAYGKPLEPRVPETASAIETALEIKNRLGPKALVWRYDPIVISGQTPAEWHLDQFGRLANRLHGATDEVVVSFVTPYAKTKRNLAQLSDLRWTDPSIEVKNDLLTKLQAIAVMNGMVLRKCCQSGLCDNIPDSSCADADRFMALGACLRASKEPPVRPGCRCLPSRDIGEYETCAHGCAYCYANNSHVEAHARWQKHSAGGESIMPVANQPISFQQELDFYGRADQVSSQTWNG